jgi:hypothetical protein
MIASNPKTLDAIGEHIRASADRKSNDFVGQAPRT